MMYRGVPKNGEVGRAWHLEGLATKPLSGKREGALWSSQSFSVFGASSHKGLLFVGARFSVTDDFGCGVSWRIVLILQVLNRSARQISCDRFDSDCVKSSSHFVWRNKASDAGSKNQKRKDCYQEFCWRLWSRLSEESRKLEKTKASRLGNIKVKSENESPSNHTPHSSTQDVHTR